MRIAFACLVLALGLATAVSAQALGTHVEAAPQSLRADKNFSVKEMRTASGVQVRKFVAPSGVIFGVAWDGPNVPNLKELLGTHFADFQAAAKGPRRRGPLQVHVGALVVENAGNMRNFHGRAFLTDEIPTSVSAAVIQ